MDNHSNTFGDEEMIRKILTASLFIVSIIGCASSTKNSQGTSSSVRVVIDYKAGNQFNSGAVSKAITASNRLKITNQGAIGQITGKAECKGLASRENVLAFAGHLATLGMFDGNTCTQTLSFINTTTGETVAKIGRAHV